MKIAKTFKEFCKIKRKFYKKNTIKRVDHINGKRFVSYWEKDDWIGYKVKSFDEYMTPSISKYVNDVNGLELYEDTKNIVEYLYNNMDKVVAYQHRYYDNMVEKGKFIGIILTNRDSYFAIDDNGQHKLVSMYWVVKIK